MLLPDLAALTQTASDVLVFADCAALYPQVQQISFVIETVLNDITRLDARLLMAFEALIEERSVTRAALRLGLSQQGLSGILQRLRDLFDDPLFVRESRGISPTPRAEALAPKVKAALLGLQQLLEAEDFDPAEAEGTITVAASDYALNVVLTPLFRPFRAQAPRVRLAALPLVTTTLGQQMRSGQIDLALTIQAFTPPNLHWATLLSERYLCAMRRDHPAARETLDLDAFCTLEHLLISPNRGDFTGTTDEALAAIGRQRRVGLVIPSFTVAGDILEQTDLIAVLPERLIQGMNRDLAVYEPPVPVPGFDLIAVWPPRLNEAPLHRWFRDHCRQAAARSRAGPVGLGQLKQKRT